MKKVQLILSPFGGSELSDSTAEWKWKPETTRGRRDDISSESGGKEKEESEKGAFLVD